MVSMAAGVLGSVGPEGGSGDSSQVVWPLLQSPLPSPDRKNTFQTGGFSRPFENKLGEE